MKSCLKIWKINLENEEGVRLYEICFNVWKMKLGNEEYISGSFISNSTVNFL